MVLERFRGRLRIDIHYSYLPMHASDARQELGGEGADQAVSPTANANQSLILAVECLTISRMI